MYQPVITYFNISCVGDTIIMPSNLIGWSWGVMNKPKKCLSTITKIVTPKKWLHWERGWKFFYLIPNSFRNFWFHRNMIIGASLLSFSDQLRIGHWKNCPIRKKKQLRWISRLTGGKHIWVTSVWEENILLRTLRHKTQTYLTVSKIIFNYYFEVETWVYRLIPKEGPKKRLRDGPRVEPSKGFMPGRWEHYQVTSWRKKWIRIRLPIL